MNLEIQSANVTCNLLDNTMHATVLHSFWEAKVNETYLPTFQAYLKPTYNNSGKFSFVGFETLTRVSLRIQVF